MIFSYIESAAARATAMVAAPDATAPREPRLARSTQPRKEDARGATKADDASPVAEKGRSLLVVRTERNDPVQIRVTRFALTAVVTGSVQLAWEHRSCRVAHNAATATMVSAQPAAATVSLQLSTPVAKVLRSRGAR